MTVARLVPIMARRATVLFSDSMLYPSFLTCVLQYQVSSHNVHRGLEFSQRTQPLSRDGNPYNAFEDDDESNKLHKNPTPCFGLRLDRNSFLTWPLTQKSCAVV